MEPRSIWREPVVIICTTLVIICLIAAATFLVAVGRTMDLQVIVRVATPAVVSLITFLGTVIKVRTVEHKIDKVPDVIANGNGHNSISPH